MLAKSSVLLHLHVILYYYRVRAHTAANSLRVSSNTTAAATVSRRRVFHHIAISCYSRRRRVKCPSSSSPPARRRQLQLLRNNNDRPVPDIQQRMRCERRWRPSPLADGFRRGPAPAEQKVFDGPETRHGRRRRTGSPKTGQRDVVVVVVFTIVVTVAIAVAVAVVHVVHSVDALLL